MSAADLAEKRSAALPVLRQDWYFLSWYFLSQEDLLTCVILPQSRSSGSGHAKARARSVRFSLLQLCLASGFRPRGDDATASAFSCLMEHLPLLTSAFYWIQLTHEYAAAVQLFHVTTSFS